jgi:hypothetical protein
MACPWARFHASCHGVQSRRQEKIEHDLTGNTGMSLTSLARFAAPLSGRFPEMGQFSWEQSGKRLSVLSVLSCPARVSPYFALHDSLRDTGLLLSPFSVELISQQSISASVEEGK